VLSHSQIIDLVQAPALAALASRLPPELVELVELGIPRRLDAWGYGLSFSA
jgi:hypothetical protein